jgi:hypothetical protein
MINAEEVSCCAVDNPHAESEGRKAVHFDVFGDFEGLVPEELGVFHSCSVMWGSLGGDVSFDGSEKDAGVGGRWKDEKSEYPHWETYYSHNLYGISDGLL